MPLKICYHSLGYSQSMAGLTFTLNASIWHQNEVKTLVPIRFIERKKKGFVCLDLFSQIYASHLQVTKKEPKSGIYAWKDYHCAEEFIGTNFFSLC